MDKGVMYVAYGKKAHDEAIASIATLRKFHDWAVIVVGDKPIKGTIHRRFEERGTPGRWAKVNLNMLTDWEQTLFIDADTRIHGDLSIGFSLLDRGYDLVIVPSRPQHNEMLRHLGKQERKLTLLELPLDVLQLNTGVMWFGKGSAPLFELWREEWERWKDKDQGALLRALYRHPVNVAVLGWPFNSQNGEVIEHRFGKCV